MIEDHAPAVLWFTGLSGAGKSTIASAVARELVRRSTRTEYLDGDAVRLLSPTGFSRAERDAHVIRVGFLASRLEHHGISVVCALISPYARARDHVRSLCERFIEIHVATPLSECERRDRKGLYARARRGEIRNFTGIDDPYEAPTNPDLAIDTTVASIDQAVGEVIAVWDLATRRKTPSVSARIQTAADVAAPGPVAGHADVATGAAGERSQAAQ